MARTHQTPSFMDVAGEFFDEMNGAPDFGSNEERAAQLAGNPVLTGLSPNQVRPTVPGTLEGFLPGESRHKTVMKTAFGNLADPGFAESSPAAGTVKDGDASWHDRQEAMRGLVSQDGVTPDAKLMNDVYVAQIMGNKDIMQTSAAFALRMAGTYGPQTPEEAAAGPNRSAFLRNKSPEMKHMWPDQDVEGTANQDYRGWQSIIGGMAASRNPFGSKDPDALSKGVGANKDVLTELVGKEGDYTLEESSYILRAMGQLRDVMKAEKGAGGIIPEWIDGYAPDADGYEVEPKNRIRVRPDAAVGAGNRNDPATHASSRGALSRWMQPLGAYRHNKTDPYKVEGPGDGEPESFDYLQGTSGTTLDMLNFFGAQGAGVEESTSLMQAFYANWHAVAPDGNAHSQSESVGTMLQYLHGTNLNAPIMTPITGAADVASMRGEGVEALQPGERAAYANPLTPENPGYLSRG